MKGWRISKRKCVEFQGGPGDTKLLTRRGRSGDTRIRKVSRRLSRQCSRHLLALSHAKTTKGGRGGSAHHALNRANALRAKLVGRAEDWNWSSLGARRTKPDADRPELTAWPIERPRNWTARVNQAFGPEEEEEAVIRSTRRGQPFGSPRWQTDVTVRLGLESAFRARGRPRKQPENGS